MVSMFAANIISNESWGQNALPKLLVLVTIFWSARAKK